MKRIQEEMAEYEGMFSELTESDEDMLVKFLGKLKSELLGLKREVNGRARGASGAKSAYKSRRLEGLLGDISKGLSAIVDAVGDAEKSAKKLSSVK